MLLFERAKQGYPKSDLLPSLFKFSCLNQQGKRSVSSDGNGFVYIVFVKSDQDMETKKLNVKFQKENSQREIDVWSIAPSVGIGILSKSEPTKQNSRPKQSTQIRYVINRSLHGSSQIIEPELQSSLFAL